MNKLQRAIFLDRDGVISKKIEGYVLKWEDFEFVPDAIPALKLLYKTGLPLFVVSNQSCANKGLIKFYQAEHIMDMMKYQLQRNNIYIRASIICPHTAEQKCSCRKPKPGMLYYLARVHDICLEDSYIIGDSWSDIQAGFNANVKYCLLINNKPEKMWFDNVIKCDTFLLAAEWAVEKEGDKK